MLNIYQEGSYWCGRAEPRSGLGSEILVMTVGCWIAPCRKRGQSLLGKGRRDSSTGRRRRAARSMPTETEALAGAWTRHKIAVLHPFRCLRSYDAARLGKGSAPAFSLYSPFYLKCFGKCPQPSRLCPQLRGDSHQQSGEQKQACHCIREPASDLSFPGNEKNLWLCFTVSERVLDYSFSISKHFLCIDLQTP